MFVRILFFQYHIFLLDMVDDFIGKGITKNDGSFEARGSSNFPRLHDIYFQIVDQCGIVEENCFNVRRGYLKSLKINKTTNECKWNLGKIDINSSRTTNFNVLLSKIQCYNNNNK
uniref:Uncharacterized protein n=1 Tax=Strongyloides stercoralis TaxID=6248 RepID=A0AAF5CWR9_STRER